MFVRDRNEGLVVTDSTVQIDDPLLEPRAFERFALQGDLQASMPNAQGANPSGLRGCGFFHVVDGQITSQRGYWDKLSFLRLHGLPLPKQFEGS